MGKTSLVRSIVGLASPTVRGGTISWRNDSLLGLKAQDIVKRGVALVPQGRRLFPSLTVTEHLTMLKSQSVKTGWTVADAFELLPRLAERRGHYGNQLSGGERGMLGWRQR